MSASLKESEQFPGAHPAPKPANEAERIEALRALGLLDTLPETAFDDIVQIASALCGVPIALVSLVDSDRQWFKARVGLDAAETHRDLAFCAHAINTPDQIFEIPNAVDDPRFRDNPLVTGDPSIRFYAGMPLVTPEGHAVGTLCVIDRQPRQLDEKQSEALMALGRRVMSEVELRRTSDRLKASEHRYRTLVSNMPAMVYRAEALPPWKVQYASDACEQITGYPPSFFVERGATWAEIMVDDDVAPVSALVAAAEAAGKSGVRVEYRIRHRDGSIRWVEDHDRLAPDGSTLEGVMLDITERKNAEAENTRKEALLRESARQLEYFRQIAEGTEYFVALAGMDRKLTYMNPAGRAAIGLSSMESVRNTELKDFVFERDRDRASTEWMPALERDGHVNIEIDVRNFITGEAVPVMWRAFRLDDPVTGEPYAIAAMGPLLAERRRIEAERDEQARALAESEARFRLITDVSPQIMWSATADGSIDFVNGEGLNYFGRSLDSLAGNGWFELVHPDDQTHTASLWSAALASGKPVEVQYRIRRADGDYRWHITRGVAQRGADGQLTRWFGVITDIEELKRAQTAAEQAGAALAQSEQRYRFLSEEIPLQVWTATPEGLVDYVNRFAANYFQRSTEEVVEQGWIDLIHPDDIPRTIERWTHSIQTHEPYEVEFRLRRHDGVYCWMLARAKALKNAAGTVEKWFGTSIEIEEIKQAQTAAEQLNAALTRSEEHYRFLSEAIPLQVWTARTDGQLDYVNGFTADYMGRSAERLLTESWDGLLHPDDVESTMKRWQHSVATGEPYEIEYRFLRHDGQFRWNLTRGLALKNAAGQVEKWFGTTVEIEDIKRAQQMAEDATRAKSAFLSSMSHEIRTPMNAVIGMTSILLDSGLTMEQRESAEIIRTSGDHLLTIINDILDYSKIEAGKLDLERAAFSVRDCIEGALDLVSANAGSQGVELGYLMEAGMPESLLGDIGRLRQVLLNLLSNAVKFTPRGGEVMVDVRAHRFSSDGLYRVEFSVSDSGVGIDPDVLPHLFQPFVQADVSTTRKFGGTGLGLSISRKLVEAMGGTIRADSVPNRGSVFHFDIVVEAAAAAGRYTPSSSAMPQLNGRRVLIVDDIEINRRILIHYVQNWGMVAHSTASSREALSWLERGDHFDLALYDYHMPDMDGMELSRRTRVLAPQLPIAILSSMSLDCDDAKIVSSAMLKPIKPARLLETVATLMSSKESSIPASAPLSELPHELGDEHPLRILVVEDNPVNQRVARLLLERMGYSADFAANGQEALTSVARQIYDVVLMDVQMPVMDGLTATRELCRSYTPETRPRIIGMTANATEEDRRNCARAGMDSYLAKPVRAPELAAALRASPRRGGGEADEDYSADGLAELRRIYGDEGAIEIIGALAADSDAQTVELQRGLEQTDLATVHRVAHTLKSNSRLVGATVLGERWEELERKTHSTSTEVSARLALALMARYGRLVRRLQAELTQ